MSLQVTGATTAELTTQPSTSPINYLQTTNLKQSVKNVRKPMAGIEYLPLDVEAMLQARLFSQDACMSCVGLTELCPACQDLRDVRDIENAHQIVDESSDYYYRGYGKNKVAVATAGSIAEPRPLSVARDAESGHDWIGSVIKISDRTKRYKVRAEMTDTSIREYIVVEDFEDERSEFLDPISLIADRIYDLETSLTVTGNETVCQDCHYLHNKAIACPNCN